MIKALVEGHGDEISLPILLKRAKGGRVKVQCIDMNGKSNIVRLHDGFEKTILRQKELGFTGFWLLLDGDVFYPPYKSLKEEKEGIRNRSKHLETQLRLEIKVFWAIRAYESWLIGGLRRGDRFCGLSKTIRGISGDTQASPIDPKKWIREHRFDGDYDPAVQACLTRRVNLGLASGRNQSLRSFLDSI
jgi:hypothetical protein